MPGIKNYVFPILAVAGGAAAAFFGWGQHATSASRRIEAELPAEPASLSDDPADAPQASAPAADDGSSIEGDVLERIDVDKYTYLRVGERGATGIWTAVPSTTTKLGDHVKLVRAQKMVDFKSTSLKRTFDAIYFGVLAGAESSHPGAAGSPHPTPTATSEAVEVGTVARAPGPLGHTVAEFYAQKSALVGKPARVRGVVVKRIDSVLERNFLHLRDGSGSSAKGNDDLLVTTQANPEVGSTVLLEGSVSADKDFGAGYSYPVLLEDAKLLKE